ncbi:MAG: mechanosensitive ion channel family protein [Solirubrobacterales bacterium]
MANDPSESTSSADAAAIADDPTGASDISYYRQSAAAKRLTAQALGRAREARREALLLLPLAAAVIALYRYREDVFGTDVPVRIVAALLLAAIGWRFARDIGRALGPRLLSRFDPGTASTVGFFARLATLAIVAIVAFRLVDVQPRALAVGGAVTAVIIGLAAQSTLGNLIAGAVLLLARPFGIGQRVRLQGSTLGGQPEGTVASIGLLYTTLARGEETVLVPNNAVLGSTIVPLHEPAGVDLRARLRTGVTPTELQRLFERQINTPTRDRPHIALEEVDADGVTVRVSAVPVAAVDGDRLADELLAAVSEMTTRS